MRFGVVAGRRRADLYALGGSFSFAEDAAEGAVGGTITNRTSGSALVLFDNDGGRLAISGGTLVRGVTALNYESGSTRNFILEETLAGRSNSPRRTLLSYSITNVLEVTLGELGGTFTLASSAAAGTVAGALTGTSSGSALELTDNAGGRLAISGTNIVATATPFVLADTYNFTVRETHSDGTNSPRDTTLSITVTAGGAANGSLHFNATTQSGLLALLEDI